MTTTTRRPRRSAARSAAAPASRFGRYALAAASGAAAVGGAPATARADFSSPYALTPPVPGTYNTAGTYGDWNAAFSGAGSSRTINTLNVPTSLTLSETNNFNSTDSFLTLSTTIVGTGSLSFSYDFTGSETTFFGGPSTAAYLVNGTPTTFASAFAAGNVMNVPVAAGDIFGFRLGVNYADSANLTISNFAAPVPEPTINALIAAGAVGLLGLRETRRRRRSRAMQTAPAV